MKLSAVDVGFRQADPIDRADLMNIYSWIAWRRVTSQRRYQSPSSLFRWLKTKQTRSIRGGKQIKSASFRSARKMKIANRAVSPSLCPCFSWLQSRAPLLHQSLNEATQCQSQADNGRSEATSPDMKESPHLGSINDWLGFQLLFLYIILYDINIFGFFFFKYLIV